MPSNSTTSIPPVQVRPDVLQKEMVAGGGFSWYGQVARALPFSIDDLTSDFGDDLYSRMSYDPQVAACLTILKASILEDGVSLAPAIEDETDPRYDQAVEIHNEAERMLDDLSIPLSDSLWNLMDSMAFGNMLAEQKYELRPGSTDKNKSKQLLQLEALKVKPRHSLVFVVDAYLNIVGLIGARPGQSYAIGVGSIIDPADPRLLPRQKFAVLTFRPHNGDPRGTSILRAAYDPWWQKRQIMPEYLKYLSQFAGPSVWATTPEGTTYQPPADYLGNPTTDTLDPITGLSSTSPEQQMLAALLQFRNGTAVVFPFGAQVHPIEMQGNGEAFLRAFARCDQQITKSVLTQELATEQGEHQARAAAQVHQDVLDTLVRQGKQSVRGMLEKDVLKNWVKYNWGDDAVDLCPKVTLGRAEQRDIGPLWTAAASLQSSGYLHPSQYPELDSELNLPARDLTMDAGLPVAVGVDAAGNPVDAQGQPIPPTGAGPAPGTPSPEPAAPPVPPHRVAVRGHERNRPPPRKPADQGPAQMAADDLDALAAISADDIELSARYWKRHSPEALSDILSAVQVP